MMRELNKWLDKVGQHLCEWLNDSFPNHPSVVIAGSALAGVAITAPLPVDRRIVSPLRYIQGPMDWADKAHVKSGLPAGNGCNFWAYCHLNGLPCTWCGGRD